MADQKPTPTDAESNWLTPEESDVCRQLAASAEPPHRQRAIALLALTGGATYAQAAEQAGLTLGQLKYCVTAFRGKRLAMFPSELAVAPAASEPEAMAPAAADSAEEADQKPAKTKKKKDKDKDKKKKGKKKKDKDKKKKKGKGKKKKKKS